MRFESELSSFANELRFQAIWPADAENPKVRVSTAPRPPISFKNGAQRTDCVPRVNR